MTSHDIISIHVGIGAEREFSRESPPSIIYKKSRNHILDPNTGYTHV